MADRGADDKERLLEGVLGLGRDSGRKSYFPQLQTTIDALKEERRKLEAVFRDAVNMLALLMPNGTIEDVNDTALSTAPEEWEHLVGTPFPEAHWWQADEDTKADVEDAVSRASGGETVRYTTKNLDKSQKIMHVDFSLRPLYDEDGNVERLLAEGREITGIVEAERRVRELNEHLEEEVKRRTAELEGVYDRLLTSEKLTGLAENAARVAHEINTPIGLARTAFSHVAETMDLDALPEETRALFDMVSRNLERSAALIRSFKKLSADQADEKRRPYDLKTVIDEVALTMGGNLRKTRQKIVVDCPEGIAMDGYPGALSTILTNLISNSREHGYPEGEEGLITIAVSKKKNDVGITYADDGRGMDETTVSHAFETFYTTRRDEGNTGLGMSLVYNLTTRTLGGAIELKSEEGNGIEVTMVIPRTAPQDAGDASGGDAAS